MFSASSNAASALVEPALLEQSASEDELGVADLVESVLAAAHERERMTRLLFGGGELARAEVHLGERRHSRRGLFVATEVDQHLEASFRYRSASSGLCKR